MRPNWKEIERKAHRADTLGKLRAEIAKLKAAKHTRENAETLEALEAWERQVADWHSRM